MNSFDGANITIFQDGEYILEGAVNFSNYTDAANFKVYFKSVSGTYSQTSFIDNTDNVNNTVTNLKANFAKGDVLNFASYNDVAGGSQMLAGTSINPAYIKITYLGGNYVAKNAVYTTNNVSERTSANSVAYSASDIINSVIIRQSSSAGIIDILPSAQDFYNAVGSSANASTDLVFAVGPQSVSLTTSDSSGYFYGLGSFSSTNPVILASNSTYILKLITVSSTRYNIFIK